jgi:hypothetical protein
MKQERLDSLMLLYIEKHLTTSINTEELIAEFKNSVELNIRFIL